MDLFTLLFVYIVMVAAAIFLLLAGELPMFMGTPIAKLHWLLFHGVCQGVWHLTNRLDGARGTQRLHALTEACCNSSNPALQLFYIAMLGIGYFYYCRDLFCFLPQPYAPIWHQYTGALALGLCLATFGAACASDPGEITPDNLAAHTALYAYDGLTSHAGQQCWTCVWQRPPRSKHCPVCNRCVARFDHHCAWINNCVGALNLRHFLAFLAANVLLTSYGVCLGCVIMQGVLDRRNAWVIAFRDSSTGEIRRLGSSPRVFMRWLLHMYPIQVALLMFMAVGLLLVLGFLAYQLVLVGSGTTTYETFKWREVARRMAVERWASGEGASSEGAGKGEPGSGRRRRLLPWRDASSPQLPPLVMPDNVYNRGLHANFVDALFPPAWARQRHGASGSVRKRD